MTTTTLTRSERAARFAVALTSTTERYHRGCLAHGSWKSHMASLWGTIKAQGLREDVLALVPADKAGPPILWADRIGAASL